MGHPWAHLDLQFLSHAAPHSALLVLPQERCPELCRKGMWAHSLCSTLTPHLTCPVQLHLAVDEGRDTSRVEDGVSVKFPASH